ncbi:MAG: hypothetical protein PVI23_14825 [Maricaulaceae bacterium]|jgi:hypothetical protein
MSRLGLLERLGASAALARLFTRRGEDLVGGAAIFEGAVNDLSAPANDAFRPHIVAKRADRRARREARSA